jgi:ABC-2 type transport system ATP-binding protein
MCAECVIEASNLTKYYGKFCAVDHISFKVEQGEIFGFLGPNGAGKTTTVRMLTGISIPSDGWATIRGHDIQKQSVEAKEVMGIVPDISNVYTELSAWDNLTFTGQLYGLSKADRERRAKELLEMFKLYDRRHEKLEDYSRGMKRRVCIAMALVNRSSILFLDEPTSGLDVQSVITIRELIGKLNQDGLTVFLTTHNMEEASQMCDRIAIINHGRIAAIDTPERLKRTTEGLQSVEIAFETMNRSASEDFKALSSVTEVRKQGDKFKLYTDNPPSVLAAVWNYAMKKGLKLITVNTVGPSLEDVFVKLTGIREEPESGARKGLRGRGRRTGGTQ